MEFKRELKNKIHRINETLENELKPVFPESLYEAMCYSLLAGGKRLRPLLLLGAYEQETGEMDGALLFAAAIEMIHTYSLIHDDLPAMDNDDFRRGKPTSHKVFGEAVAILAGDGLLNRAYEIMSDSCVSRGDAEAIRAMAIIAKAAGSRGMVGGQMVDLQCQLGRSERSKEVLQYIHSHKTGALLKASLGAGAVLAGADLKKQQCYETAGEKLGLAFQIRDDILNVTGNPDVLGKPVKSDEKKNKFTYISLYGLEKAEEAYAHLSREAFQVIAEICPSDSFLVQLFTMMTDREN